MLDTVKAVEATNEITFPWRFSQSTHNLPNRSFQYDVKSGMTKFVQENMGGEQNTLPSLKDIKEGFLKREDAWYENPVFFGNGNLVSLEISN